MLSNPGNSFYLGTSLPERTRLKVLGSRRNWTSPHPTTGQCPKHFASVRACHLKWSVCKDWGSRSRGKSAQGHRRGHFRILECPYKVHWTLSHFVAAAGELHAFLLSMLSSFSYFVHVIELCPKWVTTYCNLLSWTERDTQEGLLDFFSLHTPSTEPSSNLSLH